MTQGAPDTQKTESMATSGDRPGMAAQGSGSGQPFVPVNAGSVRGVPHSPASDLHRAPAAVRNGGVRLPETQMPAVGTAPPVAGDGESAAGGLFASGPAPQPSASSAPIVKLLRRRPALLPDDAA